MASPALETHFEVRVMMSTALRNGFLGAGDDIKLLLEMVSCHKNHNFFI
jgi:hypothetical protein